MCWNGEVSEIEQPRKAGAVVSADWIHVKEALFLPVNLRLKSGEWKEVPNTFAILILSLEEMQY